MSAAAPASAEGLRVRADESPGARPMIERARAAAPLAVILVLCLAVRLGYLAWYLQEPRKMQGDGYPEIAQNLVTGKGFSVTPLRLTWFRTPGYPLFIAAVWTIVPIAARYPAMLVAQAVLSVVTCGLTYVLADAVLGRRAALTAAFLFALSPSNVIHCAAVLPEALQLFWIALAALFALQVYRTGRIRAAIGFGLTWGAAGLTRPEATFLLWALLLPVLVAGQFTVMAQPFGVRGGGASQDRSDGPVGRAELPGLRHGCFARTGGGPGV